MDNSVRSTIRKRFSLVIPKKIREQVNLKQNDPVDIEVIDGKIVITILNEDSFEKLDRIAGDVIFNKSTKREIDKNLSKLLEI